jgi:signal peptidase complex subunit 1
MDFEGQKLAETLLIRLLLGFAALGFLAGHLLSNFQLMVYINAAGLLITLVLIGPNWPMFRQHALNWLPPLNPGGKEPAVPVQAKSAKSRKA